MIDCWLGPRETGERGWIALGDGFKTVADSLLGNTEQLLDFCQ